MNKNIREISIYEIAMFILLFIIMCIGFLTVFSSTYFFNDGLSDLARNQLIFYTIGVVLIWSISYFDYLKLKHYLPIIFFVLATIGLLIAVLFYGEEVYGAKRWIDIGFFNLQPSEVAKITTVLAASFFLTKQFVIKKTFILKADNKLKVFYKKVRNFLAEYSKKNNFGLNLVFLTVFILGVNVLVLAQKSLGNTILINLILITIIFFNLNLKLKHFFIIICSIISSAFGVFYLLGQFDLKAYILSAAVLGIVILYTSLKTKLNLILSLIFFVVLTIAPVAINFIYVDLLQPYQRSRIESFIGKTDEVGKIDKWNESQAITAVGSGLFKGKGFLKGSVTNTGYLPFAYTDFAFAAFAEQFGFIGIIIFFILYSLFLIMILLIYNSLDDKFGKLICVGIFSMILFNFIQHVGMNMGLLPITGVPLPFISYGGSSNLVFFLGVGLVVAIKRNKANKKVRVIDLS